MATVVLSGGVGAARFLSGLVTVIEQEEIIVISNTGDDSEFYGLYICPDIDIVIYTLAGAINSKTGWGLENDTFNALTELGRLGCDTWFNLGDRDLATHIYRTMLLRQGMTLSEVTRAIAKAWGLELAILPMSDRRVETIFNTGTETLSFQEYLVKHRFQIPVQSILFKGAREARPAPGVLEAIGQAERIIIAPSNPYISIGTILAVPGIREALEQAPGTIAAISPIVGGEAVKGPAAQLLRGFGRPVSPVGVAELYSGFLDMMVVDERDKQLIPEIEAMGIRATATDTMMTCAEAKSALAKRILDLIP